jgi:hypothetical protein
MSSVATGIIALVCVFGGALLGMFLRTVLPKHHLESETKDVVKLGMGLVGTMAALILGLLVSSAKGNYDAQSAELTQVSANILMLDRVLSHYGPEANAPREALKVAAVRGLDTTWSKTHRRPSQVDSGPHGNESLYEIIHELSPKDEAQRSLKSEALSIALNLGQTRWLMYEQESTSASKPLVIVMVFWLSIIFVSWGLFAPANGTVIAAFFAAGLAVSVAIFLILEMYAPYSGLIQVSSAPLRAAIARLGQ